MKRWVIAESMPVDAQPLFPDLPPVALQLLSSRGVKTQEQIEAFFAPNWERDTFSPDVFLQMKPAVARAFAALEAGEPMGVHGDYDGGGVSESVVVISTLREFCRFFPFSKGELEGVVSFYIPHREKEG